MSDMPRLFSFLTLAGIAGTVAALAVEPHAALTAYLAAAAATSSLPIGAFLVLMVTYLVPGRWTTELHVPLTAAALTIPIAALMFLPVIAGMAWIYPWVQARPEPTFKAIWLTPWFFVLRSIIYFAVWAAFALWIRNAWGEKTQMTRAASAGLIVYALTGSLAGVDWIESLTPDFHSSIYGLLFMTFQLLAGLSFGIAMTMPGHGRAAGSTGYGALLLSALLLWAYFHAMQYIIIWSGNIPAEVDWYLRRLRGGWGVVLWGLIVLQFIVPFFALLFDRVRNRTFPLLVIAGMTLVLRFVESSILVLPESAVHAPILWLAVPATIATTIGILGLALQLTLGRLERSPADRRELPAAEPSA